ncbi:hypothetical protein PRNP1_001446 [Phytophthora ramorum]
MKLSAIFLAAAGIASSVSAATSTAGSAAATTTSTSKATSAPGTVATDATLASSSTASSAAATGSSTTSTTTADDVFANLKTTKYSADSYHMPAVRAVHARVQSDAPILVDGVFVSSFGDGELEAGGSGFVYPTLKKAYTTLSENETTTDLGSAAGNNNAGSGLTAGSNSSSAAAPLTFTAASVAVGLMTAVLAL